MLKTLALLSILASVTSFAQDMSRTEDYHHAYTDMPDGTDRYIGKCTTHQDYSGEKFSVTATLQDFVKPERMSDEQIAAMLDKFDAAAIKLLLETFEMYGIGDEGESDASLFANYVDDLTVEKISLKAMPELELIRFNMGVGGGNGGYLVLNRTKRGSKTVYEKISYIFDGDVNFCDLKVWGESARR